MRSAISLVLAASLVCIAQSDDSNARLLVRRLDAQVKTDGSNAALRIELGVAYLRTEEYDKALAELRIAVKLAPSSAEAHNWLGVALAAKVDLVEAIAEYRKAVSLDPKLARTWTNLGAALSRAGQIRESVEAFGKALALTPEEPAARMNLAVALRASGDASAALEHVRYVAERNRDDFGVQFELGQTLRQAGDLEGAVQAFEAAIRLNPEYREGYYNLALTLRQIAAARRRPVPQKPSAADEPVQRARDAIARGDLATATADLTRALTLDPSHAGANTLMGFVLGQQRSLTAAIQHLDRAVALQPESAEARYYRAVALWYQGSRDGALSEIRMSVRLDPAYGESYAFLGSVLKDSNDLDGARRNLQRAIALLRPQPATYIDLGLVLLASGDTIHAIGQFEAALNLPLSSQPRPSWDAAATALRNSMATVRESAEAHNILGRLMGRAGADAKEVIAEFREAIRLRPGFPEAHNNVGLVLTQAGDDEAAIAAFRDAIRYAPDYAEAHANLGAALTPIDVAEAIRELEKAVALDPSSFKTRYNLAVAYGISPDHGSGREIGELRTVIAAAPTFAKARLALAKALLRTGEVRGALEQLEAAVKIEPESGEAHYQLGLALARAGRHAEAVPELQKGRDLVAAAERTTTAGLDISEGKDALERNEPDVAIAKFRRALMVVPDSAVANRMLGLALLKKGDRDGAVAAFRKAAELDPSDTVASTRLESLLQTSLPADDPHLRGVVEEHIREKRFVEAESLLTTYVAEQPNSWWGWYALGYSQFGRQKIGASIQSLARSLQLNVNNAEAHKILGRNLMLIGRFDVARTEFEVGIRLDPKSAEMHYNLGKLFSVEDNWGPARAALEEAVRLDSSYVEAWDALGFAREATGDDEGAVAAYERAIKLNDDRKGTFSSAHVNLSAYYNRTGQPDRALEYSAKAIELNPKSDRAWFQKARAHERLGNLEQAVDAANRAIAANSHASSYYYVLATLYRRMGKTAESRKALEEFARLDRESGEFDKRRRETSGAPLSRESAHE